MNNPRPAGVDLMSSKAFDHTGLMKTRLAPNRLLGVALLVSAVAGGPARAQTQGPPVSAPANPPAASFPAKQTAASGVEPASVSDKIGSETRAPVAPEVSSALADFLRMTRTGVDESGLLTCVKTASGAFDLGADQIIYLQKLGVSGRVIIAMLQHDANLLSGGASAHTQGLIKPSALANQDNKQTNSAPGLSPAQVSPFTVSSSRASELEAQASALPRPYTLSDLAQAGQDDQPELYPVRKPYPVKLSDPIIVLRAPTLTPNLVVVQPLP
jgi:hypothetical protein